MKLPIKHGNGIEIRIGTSPRDSDTPMPRFLISIGRHWQGVDWHRRTHTRLFFLWGTERVGWLESPIEDATSGWNRGASGLIKEIREDYIQGQRQIAHDRAAEQERTKAREEAV